MSKNQKDEKYIHKASTKSLDFTSKMSVKDEIHKLLLEMAKSHNSEKNITLNKVCLSP